MAAMQVLLYLVTLVISEHELNRHQTVDRSLYTVLVMELGRDPMESMKVMALWIWLEHKGFDNIVRNILTLPEVLINELADEAVTCLNCIYNTNLHEASEIPLTQILITEEEFSLEYLLANRDEALADIHNNVCIRALADVMEMALSGNNNLLSAHANNNNRVMTAEERTMFVTFSKGYPVAAGEVRDFFTQLFGDCIESLTMQDVGESHEQPLFARIVFFRPDFIHVILNGVSKAKFTINGKHVWMRKFVPKKPRNVTAPQSTSGSHSD